MTLLSDIVKVLHDADMTDYSVHTSAAELPGAPDLVVLVDQRAEGDVTDLLVTSRLPISQLKRVSRGVIHVWQRQPSD